MILVCVCVAPTRRQASTIQHPFDRQNHQQSSIKCHTLLLIINIHCVSLVCDVCVVHFIAISQFMLRYYMYILPTFSAVATLNTRMYGIHKYARCGFSWGWWRPQRRCTRWKCPFRPNVNECMLCSTMAVGESFFFFLVRNSAQHNFIWRPCGDTTHTRIECIYRVCAHLATSIRCIVFPLRLFITIAYSAQCTRPATTHNHVFDARWVRASCIGTPGPLSIVVAMDPFFSWPGHIARSFASQQLASPFEKNHISYFLTPWHAHHTEPVQC